MENHKAHNYKGQLILPCTYDDSRRQGYHRKLAQVLRLVQKDYPDATLDEISDICGYDWPEGEDHQRWLKSAPALEIAGWLWPILRDERANREAD
jgi:hypothetical protein